MNHQNHIDTLLAPALDAMGYDVVRIQLSGSKNLTLQVMVEPKDHSAMTVDHCAEISRRISAILDVEDPISEAYALEVSSPGIDRPLVKTGDFERYAGYDVRIELKDSVPGRKRYKGKLLGMEDGAVAVLIGDERFQLRFADIDRAKLLLTDELLAEAARAAEA